MSQQFSSSSALSALARRLETLAQKATSMTKKYSAEEKNLPEKNLEEKNLSSDASSQRERIKKNLLLERIDQCLGTMEHDLVTILQHSSPEPHNQSPAIPPQQGATKQ